jgi:multiple sugar transport system permease protein
MVVETVETTVAPAAASRRSRRPLRDRPLTAWLFLAPYLALFTAFVLAPIVFGFWISLHNWDFTLPNKPYVGLQNYRDLLNPDSVAFSAFWNAMQATGIFMLFSVPLLIAVPLGVALLMNQRFRGRNFVRAVYFAPYVLGVAVVGVLWRFLLDANIGAVNWLAGVVGLPDKTPWLSSLPEAWIALVWVTVWWTLGFNAVIFLAGLQDIPRDLYEAAKVDGAGPVASFWNVTLPGLRPVMLFVVMTTIIASANMFGQSYIMTNGAPGQETRTAIFEIAITGLRNFQMGSAAAASWILTLTLIMLSLIVFALFRERTEDRA